MLVEDGTGLATANSYAEIAFADDYFAGLGVTAWATLSVDQKTNALRAATDYADIRWAEHLIGGVATAEQALQFPRTGLYDTFGNAVVDVPPKWKRAICEYALASTLGSLYPEAPGDSREVKKEKVVVGPITEETEYFGVASRSDFKSFTKADALVALFIRKDTGAKVFR